MKNKYKVRTKGKKLGRAAVALMLVIAFMVTMFPQKEYRANAASEVIGYGVLTANWVNLGLNWNMTGGTSGRVVKGEKLTVFEQKLVNGTDRYYVYAQNANIYGYISGRYMEYTPINAAEGKVLGHAKVSATWVNLGLNWYMTGGTSGRVVNGDSLILYDKKVVNNTDRYYVYAERAGIYGYISGRYITDLTLTDNVGNEGNEDKNGIILDVDLHVQEKTTTCGVASVKMVLDYLDVKSTSGKRISEAVLWRYANSNGQGTYVYRVAQTLTQYGAPYKYVSMSNAGSQGYWDVLEESLEKNRPVLLPIKPSKNAYWNYNSGHYIVVTGLFEDANGVKQVVINDCHYRYSAEDKVIPLSELVRVSKNHSSYLIVGK